MSLASYQTICMLFCAANMLKCLNYLNNLFIAPNYFCMTGVDLPALFTGATASMQLFLPNGHEPSMQIAPQIFGSMFTQICSQCKFCETLSTGNDRVASIS